MLADTYDPLKFKPNGSYLSEKLDGIRALWLPFTMGLNFRDVPWANTARDERNPVCSGLWTRRGKNIAAPSWFIEALPNDIPLDGELFLGRQKFQETMSVVRKLEPVDDEWENIVYKVFDIPSYQQFFTTGQIRDGGRAGDPAYEVFFRGSWADLYPGIKDSKFWPVRRFSENIDLLSWLWDQHDTGIFEPLSQYLLPHTHSEAEEIIYSTLEDVVNQGGEGLMLRRGHSIWEPKRCLDLAKVKKLKDDEAQVVGFTFGKGKFRGMVGAVKVRWNPTNAAGPKIFELSGFTERERELYPQFEELARDSEGQATTEQVSRHFPIGSAITFQYNELTKDGVPRFARYYRKFDPGDNLFRIS